MLTDHTEDDDDDDDERRYRTRKRGKDEHECKEGGGRGDEENKEEEKEEKEEEKEEKNEEEEMIPPHHYTMHVAEERYTVSHKHQYENGIPNDSSHISELMPSIVSPPYKYNAFRDVKRERVLPHRLDGDVDSPSSALTQSICSHVLLADVEHESTSRGPIQ